MFEIVVQKYREELIHYCIAQTHMSYADAEDIVQDVFLILYCKKNINFENNIRAWLYETTRRKIKAYYRKNPQHDALDAIADKQDFSYELSAESGDSILDVLTKQEYQLLTEYFSGCDRNYKGVYFLFQCIGCWSVTVRIPFKYLCLVFLVIFKLFTMLLSELHSLSSAESFQLVLYCFRLAVFTENS